MNVFNKIELLPRSELKALQNEKLVKTVKYVYSNSSVYRAKMDAVNLKPSDIKSIDDIVKLPFTTKQDMRDNYPFGMLCAPKRDIVRLHASSGTTGKLTVAAYTKKDIDIWAECCARALMAAGGSFESTIHVAYGYGLFTGGLGMHYGAEKLGAATVPVSSGNTKRQLQLLKDFEADIICCTPSYAIYLAEEMAKEGMKKEDFRLKAGLFGAEPWSKSMKAQIEKLWGITAYDIYGLSEISGPGVAMDCEIHNGVHYQEDHFYPEIVNPDTLEPVPYGTRGELVITTLSKEGMPLIRYRTRDITSLTDEVCRCGRTHVRMSRIKGRSDDMMIIRGVNVFPSQIETVLLGIDGVEPQYQIVLDRINNLDTMELQVEVNDRIFSDEVKKIENFKKGIESEIMSAIGVSCSVRMVAGGSLPRSEGKAKRIIDRRII